MPSPLLSKHDAVLVTSVAAESGGEGAEEQPSARAGRRPLSALDLDPGPTRVVAARIDQPSDAIAPDEVTEGGAARCVAQVQVACGDDRGAGGRSERGDGPSVAVPSTGVGLAAV